jgi:hypothetical protein
MNGYQQGAITGGIGQGLDKAASNILNLYGMKQRFDLWQQGLDIDKQKADTNTRRSQLKDFGSPHHWDHANLSKFHQPTGASTPGQPGLVGPPQAMRLGLGVPPMTGDPQYLQPDANALRDY